MESLGSLPKGSIVVPFLGVPYTVDDRNPALP